MSALPPLLKNYEEGRWLIEAKGWGLTSAAEHLAAMPELARFQLSQTTFSRKAKPGRNVPIEPEVAAAVEGLKTWVGSEGRAELVTQGLRVLHGGPPIVDVDVERLAQKLRVYLPASELASRLEALEDRLGMRAEQLAQTVEGLGRFSWKHAFSGGVGAFVGCLVLVPLLLIVLTAISAGTRGHTIPPGGPDTSPRWFEPEAMLPDSQLRLAEWGEKRPLDQTVPFRTLPGQKVAPCNEQMGEEAINGNCWAWQGALKPPCGVLFRHGDKCYRAIRADPTTPVGHDR